jgi:anthranilate synthase component 1
MADRGRASWGGSRGLGALDFDVVPKKLGVIGAGDTRMDLAITIRTCVIADGVANVQAGAGIVHDSVPEKEWDETETKARAMLTAIGRARAAANR